MACEEKERLLAAYQRTTEKFSHAVTELHHKIEISSQEEYQRLQRVADEARVHSERARLALESHSAAHGC